MEANGVMLGVSLLLSTEIQVLYRLTISDFLFRCSNCIDCQQQLFEVLLMLCNILTGVCMTLQTLMMASVTVINK